MTQLLRVKTRWSGFNGGPGYTVLHFRDFGAGDGGGGDVTSEAAAAAGTRVLGFFDSVKTYLAPTVRIQVESDVDVIEDTNGELVASFAIPAKPELTGNGTGPYSAASGAVVNWSTAGIRNGRKIRGRSFLVPLSGTAMDATGQLNAAARNAISTAAVALANSTGTPDLGVYARPTVKGATDGRWFVVTSSSVPSKAAILTSRRD